MSQAVEHIQDFFESVQQIHIYCATSQQRIESVKFELVATIKSLASARRKTVINPRTTSACMATLIDGR